MTLKGTNLLNKWINAKEKSIVEPTNKVKAANEQTTIKAFITAYFIAMKYRPFSDCNDLLLIPMLSQ